MEKDKATKIGLILIILCCIIYWGFNFLKGKNVFVKENTYYAQYERIDGLQKNSAILLRGTKIGQVKDIYFTSKDYSSITVVLSIQKDLELPVNTVARIFSSDIMGTKSIELIIPRTSGEKEPILKNGATFLSDIEGGITDQVRLEMAPIKKQAEKLMQSTETAIEQIKYVLNESTGEHLRVSFLKIQSAVDAIHNSSVTIDTILTKGNKNIQSVLMHMEAITATVSNKTEEINNIINNFSRISDTLARANVAETILKADSVLTSFSTLLDKINKGKGTFASLINDDTLYKNLEATSNNLENLLLDIQKNPKKYVSFPLMNFSKNTTEK